MKRNHAVALSTLLLVTGLNAAQAADSFSAKEWAQSLKTAFAKNDTKTLVDKLNIDDIEIKTLARQETPDRKAMNTARDLFAKGKFAESISFYDQVGKDSDFWIEAVEEKGWAYLRLSQSEKAIAQTRTLTAETFNTIVGSEPYFLQSLSELKICDYVSVLQTHRDFKSTQRARIAQMQNLVDHGMAPEIKTSLKQYDSFPLTLSEVKEDAKRLPLLFYRDQQLQKALLQMRMADAGIPVLKEAIANKVVGASALERIVDRLQKDAKKGQDLVDKRVKALAQTETNHNFKILQKLNLVEVETIQRVHTDQGADTKAYQKSPEIKAGPDDLVFNDDGNPWIDELDKYQVDVKACPQNVRRKM